jgi:tetratricopeptide (TPR) repeat protein
MNDPYGVLGLSSSATDNEVKKAYRELARKYHPDNYHDNPLADLAQDKMKEINEAYNLIMRMREGGGNQYYNSGGANASGRSTYSGSAQGAKVRAAIDSGDYDYAEQLLRSFPDRGAEWNFLTGSLYYRKGWLNDAKNYFRAAVNLDPSNMEYRQALAFMEQGGKAHTPYEGTKVFPLGCGACNCCTTMLCLSLCCPRRR